MRKSAALAASLSVLLVWLVALNVHLRRHDAATQALKTIHLVIDGAGQIHHGEATGADSRSISLDLGSTADLAAGAAHSQTIHLDLDQHGHIIHNAVSGGRVVSLTLNSDGQVVPDTDARSAVPGDRTSSLAQEKEDVPNYNTYPKLTWPEPPHGFGMYGGRSAARHGRAHQGYAAAVPIVIELPPDANARRPHHTEALRAADSAHGEDDMFRADEKRLLRRMSDRMRSRERKEVKAFGKALAFETNAAVTKMREALSNEVKRDVRRLDSVGARKQNLAEAVVPDDATKTDEHGAAHDRQHSDSHHSADVEHVSPKVAAVNRYLARTIGPLTDKLKLLESELSQ